MILPAASRIAIALSAQAAVFWAVVALVPPGLVTNLAWLVLHGLGIVAFLATRAARWPDWPPYKWFATTFYAAMLAVMFFFLNIGQDILKGADRPKAEVAQHLGGVEIWFFLCPGVAAFALARAIDARLFSRRACTAPLK